MYKIIIQNLNEYEETTSAWKNPDDPKKIYYSKFDVQDEVTREKLVSHQRPTGKTLTQPIEIFAQVVEKLELQAIIKAINNLK